ncbi:protein Bouncer-like isoform X1 [Sphaerodactylus townsendi]|uniref:protein Bouncer-like isoform X1 n=1 Tax=Sphaerodactylus townsendi TaxID=933632 RepID=UPI0020267EBA|nr:protein Bouncer-like isoform X1 [Sphaerodactylus townsendi]
MGKLLVLCVAVLAYAGIGSSLYCYKCSFTMIFCRTNVTCQTGEVCATIIGSAAKHDVIQKKGCVAREKCNTTSTETYVGVNYTTRYKCCEGNACNSAPTLSSAHLSLAMVLAMLGFWCTQLL